MQGVAVPATIRFSNGSGNPKHPDWAPDPRGLAVKFYLPDDSRTDIHFRMCRDPAGVFLLLYRTR